MTEGILKKIEEITKVIDLNEKKVSYYSSVSKGLTGLVIYRLYQYKFSKDVSYLDQLHTILIKAIDYINSDDYPKYFIYRDIGEIGRVLLILIKSDVLSVEDVEDLLDNFDEILHSFMHAAMKEENYDAVVGALLVGNYFVERIEIDNSNEKVKTYLNELSNNLVQNCKREKDRIFWNFHFNKLKEIHLGRSHGMCSIIAFLLKLKQHQLINNITESVDDIIKGAVRYVLDQRLPMSDKKSLYPFSVGQESSSIGNLIYGDLAIGFTLKAVADAFDWQEVNTEADEILDRFYSISIDDNENINDPNLIYGTSGIASVFKRLYLLYEDEKYNKYANQYLKYTLDYSKHDNDLAGYKIFWNTSDEWTNYCFTQGLIGIGITLLGSQIDEVDYLALLNY